MAPRRSFAGAVLLATLAALLALVSSQNVSVNGLHVFRWFTGGGGMCENGMSVADCSYRRLLMRHIKNNLYVPLTPGRRDADGAAARASGAGADAVCYAGRRARTRSPRTSIPSPTAEPRSSTRSTRCRASSAQ